MSYPADLGEFKVYRGDAWAAPTINDGDDSVPSVPTHWADFGDTWACQARTSADADPPVTVDVDVSTDGVMLLTMDADTTADLEHPEYVADVKVSGGPISPLTLFTFRLRVFKDVTHA